MQSHVKLALDGSPFTAFEIERFEFQAELSELFEISLRVHDNSPHIDFGAVVGKAATISLPAEPFVKELRGVVRRLEQVRTSPKSATAYELIIVPPLWLTTRQTNNRIFQDKNAIEIVLAVLAGYGEAIPAPHLELDVASFPEREYRVQYGESDFEFISRILADEGITSYFDHNEGSRWVLTQETPGQSVALSEEPVLFRPDSGQVPSEPHVTDVSVRSGIRSSAAMVVDWDYTRPKTVLASASEPVNGELFDQERNLRIYEYELGKDWNGSVTRHGNAIVLRERALRRVVACQAGFVAFPGVHFKIEDHPRDDVNRALLIYRVSIVRSYDPEKESWTADGFLECIDRETPFFPALREKARIHGTQTAIVVTESPEQEISVDELGRVKVAFRWDERRKDSGNLTRWIRVSHGTAGLAYGFMMHPRRGDEVIVSFLDGDPDEPIIVGRVFNGAYPPVLKLPEHKTQSVWLSRTTPGGEGFNKILMEDLKGSELLELHGQRDFKNHANRNSDTSVGANQTISVAGGQSTSAGSVSVSSGSTTTHVSKGAIDITSTGAGIAVTAGAGDLVASASALLSLGAATIKSASNGKTDINADGALTLASAAEATLTAPQVSVHGTDKVAADAPLVTIHGTSVLTCHGDGSLFLHSGGVARLSGATVKLVGDIVIEGGSVTIKGSPVKIDGGTVTITGSPIKLNC